MHSNILTTGTITETRRSHEFDRQTWALVCSVIALVWVATSQGSGGRSPDDRLYYKKIRKNVGFAPPAWLFGPVWSVWIIFIILNTTFFANNPVVEANTDLYEASFILFLAWVSK